MSTESTADTVLSTENMYLCFLIVTPVSERKMLNNLSKVMESASDGAGTVKRVKPLLIKIYLMFSE